jgi:diaminopimelate epimerase
MRFTKMHGLGNDYIYVDCFAQAPPRDPAALSKAVSDRHFGVGADGLILIGPSERADARMRMFNADGSEAEMCGNGVRCVAKYIHDHGLARKPTVTVETGRGVLRLDLETRNDKVERVRVDMGEPILDAAKIPTTLPGERVVNYPFPKEGGALEVIQAFFQASGIDPRVTCVSMGNPHAVFYCPDVRQVPLDTLGRMLEADCLPLFPRRVNVHFVQVHSPAEATMRTWERGSGVTLACGTGACAVAVAGVLTGRTGRRLTAHLPGGDLLLEWSDADNHVFMTGPAVEVFSGDWPSA